jgi:hypothetical protein
MVEKKNNDNDAWIAPVLGLLGVAGAIIGSMFLTNNSGSSNSSSNSLPRPPVGGQKPGGCGCQHKKTT